MTFDDANAALLVLLLADRMNWPAPQVEAWRQMIQQRPDPQAALAASDRLVKDFEPRDWSVHRWLETYAAEARSRAIQRELNAAPAPVEEEVISLKEHLRRLSFRADCGERDAAKELANWRKHGRKYFPDEAAL